MKDTYNSLKKGLISGFPIIIGYFPVAMAFGLLSKNTGISLRDSCFFSLFVYAGASQFMALDLVRAGAAVGNIIFATFLLNLRHMMMSASLSVKIKEIRKRWIPLIAFGITDETFSVSSMKDEKLDTAYLLALHTAAYLSWTSGTFTGYLIGTILPDIVQNSLGIGLYAMFAALLMPEVRKSLNVLFLSLASGAIYIIITISNIIPSGWSLVAAVIISSGLGVVLLKDDTAMEEERDMDKDNGKDQERVEVQV